MSRGPATHPVTLSLAHSGDPDDAFMWWPITGKVGPDGVPWKGEDGRARIDCGRFTFRAIPGDIEQFNRRAAEYGDYDITALSVRVYPEVRQRYVMTLCGGSFGEGYGPKVVAKADRYELDGVEQLRDEGLRIAIPGRRTTAFLVLSLLLGKTSMFRKDRFVELPFDLIIPAVASGEVDAGLVIHEGQTSFEDAGLKQLVDLGSWWKQTRNLPLPLGINAIRRDFDGRFGEGSQEAIVSLLRQSIAYALAHRSESVHYTLPYAVENARRSGTQVPTIEGVDRYISMYVTPLTTDMGGAGLSAIGKLLAEGHAAGLCSHPGEISAV